MRKIVSGCAMCFALVLTSLVHAEPSAITKPILLNKYSFAGVSLGTLRTKNNRPSRLSFLGLHGLYDTEIFNEDSTLGIFGGLVFNSVSGYGEEVDGDTTLLTGCLTHGYRLDAHNHIRIGIGITYAREVVSAHWGRTTNVNDPYKLKKGQNLLTATVLWTFTTRPVQEREWGATLAATWREDMGILFTIAPGILMRYIDDL